MNESIEQAVADLAIANRILGHENIVDVYGHVSIRHPEHPDRFLLSRARSPELIEPTDILEYHLDGTPVVDGGPISYIERFIHGAIFESRPEIHAICHNHALSILPFSISTSVHLQAVIQTARFIGTQVPVWDIADDFGDSTDLLVRNIEQGRSLARTVGGGAMSLMRGHGGVVLAGELAKLVMMCVAMDRNAQVQLQAHQLGGYASLGDGEIVANDAPRKSNGDNRGWEYFRQRAGIVD